MKKIITAGFAALVMALGAITSAAPGNAAVQSSQVPGQIIVKFRDKGAATALLRQYSLSEGTGIGSTQAQLIKVPAGQELQLLEALNRNPAVEYAEPDYVATAATADPYFDRQYALHNTGKGFFNTNGDIFVAGGTEELDVDAVDAWGLATGATAEGGIKVAVLDTGVDDNHEDISSNVLPERANFSDALTGEDNYGHGTHVAGIIAATPDNGKGVAGVCPGCKILDVKVLNDNGSGSASRIAKGIDWAVEKDAKIINMSLGLRVSSRTLETAVNNAWNAGAVIVAAAGNAGTQAKIYPGAYPNVIAVAATDNNDAKASFSTYGRWVDVAAPGVSVYSTFPNHPNVLGEQNNRALSYDIASGTSMASPIVAAVAALVWSRDAAASNAAVRDKVELTADPISGTGTYWEHGRVNAESAVR